MDVAAGLGKNMMHLRLVRRKKLFMNFPVFLFFPFITNKVHRK